MECNELLDTPLTYSRLVFLSVKYYRKYVIIIIIIIIIIVIIINSYARPQWDIGLLGNP